MHLALIFSTLALSLVACNGDGKTGTDSPGTTGDSGTDSGGSTAVLYEDADGDGIIDAHEGGDGVDTDGDGTADYLDVDSDGDGIKDSIEAGDEDPLTLPVDSDSDGVPDYQDSDSDNNCISDSDEKGGDKAVDTDEDGTRDYADPDNDGDGVLDIYEIGEDCGIPDTDGDGHADYMDDDSDGDGIGDLWEAGNTEFDPEPADTDGDGIYDYLDDDSDGDGLPDSVEGGVSDSEMEPNDTDGDGKYDFADTDSDGDSLTDSDETNVYGTDPYDSDTDSDGFSDGGEITAGTDPSDASSVIDGLYVEVPERTTTEEVFEFELRIQMGDVAFLVDTTCSMSSTANAMASEYSAIVSTLASSLPDAEYGFATFDDYPCCGYGSPGTDKPFELRQQITNDVGKMTRALAATSIHSGSDGPESGMEALYQSANGGGYDMGCNGSYDANLDVKPFKAGGSDPFGGTGGQFYDASDLSTGALGGFGFRDYALPVIVYATDNYLRDADSSVSTYNGTPHGCPTDAGSTDVIASVAALGAYLVGINTYSTISLSQMEALAAATNSYADTDGDGIADESLVFAWSGSSATFRTTVTEAIEDLISSIRFNTVSLEVEGDEWGFVTGIDPTSIEVAGSVEGEIVEFTLTFRGVVAATTEDALYKLTLNVLGDSSTLLDTLDIIVVVPGTSY